MVKGTVTLGLRDLERSLYTLRDAYVGASKVSSWTWFKLTVSTGRSQF